MKKGLTLLVILLCGFIFSSYGQNRTHRLVSRTENEVKKTGGPSKTFTLTLINAKHKFPIKNVQVRIKEFNLELTSDSLGMVSFEIKDDLMEYEKVTVEFVHYKYHLTTLSIRLKEHDSKTIRLIRSRWVIDGCPSF